MSSDNSATLTTGQADEIEEKLTVEMNIGATSWVPSPLLTTTHSTQSQIRERADVPSGSMNHYLETLTKWGIVEDTGQREYSRGRGPEGTRLAAHRDGRGLHRGTARCTQHTEDCLRQQSGSQHSKIASKISKQKRGNGGRQSWKF